MKLYPKLVTTLDGARRVVNDYEQEEAATGVKMNPDGTPAEIEVKADVPAADNSKVEVDAGQKPEGQQEKADEASEPAKPRRAKKDGADELGSL